MSSLTPKASTRIYWYLRETAWVDGKSKVVKTVYLGSAAQIASALGKGTTALQVTAGAPVVEFGAVTALYDVVQRLGLVDMIDRHVPKRGSGPSVGTLLVLAAINRAVAPTSKAGMATWYERTSLSRWFQLKPTQLTSQRFWDNMDRVPPEAIIGIERELATKVIEDFDLDLRCVFYDATNFFTFIDTFNARSTLAQRGKSKEGRRSLRILGLALMVTGDFEVPLFHSLYPGNHNDATSFRAVVQELVDRYRLLCRNAEDLTIVFDKGNNTEDTVAAIAGKYHVVGSLVQTHHPAVARGATIQVHTARHGSLPRRRVGVPDDEGGVRAPLHGAGDLQRESVPRADEDDRTGSGQATGEAAGVPASTGHMADGRAEGPRPSVASVEKAVRCILRGQHMTDLFAVTIQEAKHGLPVLRYRFDRAAYTALQRRRLGKTLLFTDHSHWSDEDIVSAYRGQHHVENAFRQMKDVHYVSFRPAHHWTDQKLQVHAFTCVLALMLCSLLRCELARKGVRLSIDRILETLETVREVQVLLSSGRGRPRLRRTHSKLAPLAKELFTVLNLGRYLPS